MSDSLSSKSGTDISSNSSWSVIEESEISRRSSLEKITIENDSDSQNISENYQELNSVEDEIKLNEDDVKAGFVSFDEFAQEEITKTEQDKSKNNSQKCKNKKRRRKFKAEPLNIMSIVASILTLTGITLLCMLFSQNFEQETLDKVQNNYADLVNNRDDNLEHYLNKTSNLFQIANDANLFKKIEETVATDEDYIMDDDECPKSDEYNSDAKIDFISFDADSEAITPPLANPYTINKNEEKIQKTDIINPLFLHNFQNTTMALFKDVKEVLASPQLHILLCTVLQDICLVRLLNQLNKYKAKESQQFNDSGIKPNSAASTNLKNKKLKKSKVLKKKPGENKMKETKKQTLNSILEDKCSPKKVCTEQNIFALAKNSNVQITNRTNEDAKNVTDIQNVNENGKSECERRFENLDNKWESIGQIHRQKIKEIKEKFKNEVYQIKESGTELFLRSQRIKLIRDKYIQRLKLDRERYLHQLKKLKEERDKLMNELCHKKNNEVNLKDASVGNYAILIPDTYDFQQRLRILRNKGNKSQVYLPSNDTNSYPKLSSLRKNKFMKYDSIPNISKKPTNTTDQHLKPESNENSSYMVKLQQYSEMRNKYLEKKNMRKIKQNTMDAKNKEKYFENPLVEDVISRMITSISDSKSKVYQSFSNSSVETVKENGKMEVKEETPLPSDTEEVNDQNIVDSENKKMNSSNERFKLVVRRKPRKQDIYDIAFNKNSKKIKHEDTVKWNHDSREKFPPQHGLPISKQNPEKSYKEKILIKTLL